MDKHIGAQYYTIRDFIQDVENFDKACEYAGVEARALYREEAKQIEEIRKDIIAVSNNEAPYDIFICYKETAENGDRTLDSVLAQDIYDALTDKGYRVFFSRITLEDKLGMEYEPYIFAALNSAKIMLAFGTDYEYFNAVWVKNEWSRFLEIKAKDSEKRIIPCYVDIDDVPKELRSREEPCRYLRMERQGSPWKECDSLPSGTDRRCHHPDNPKPRRETDRYTACRQTHGQTGQQYKYV